MLTPYRNHPRPIRVLEFDDNGRMYCLDYVDSTGFHAYVQQLAEGSENRSENHTLLRTDVMSDCLRAFADHMDRDS
jgi:hypothetical protein